MLLPSFATEAVALDSDGLLLSTGVRSDELKWSIAGNTAGTNPNILSELTWEDLNIFQVRADWRRSSPRGRLYYKISFDYGWITDGTNRDSDYNGDNRTLEYSRSDNKSGDGSVWDLTSGIGYRFSADDERMSLIPMVGVSLHRQNLVITDGYQTLSKPPSSTPIGPFAGLDSRYNARWGGLWLGADFIIEGDRFGLLTSFEAHSAHYYAEADWNLRTDFNHPKSFDHDADGYGLVIAAEGDYNLTERLTAAVLVDLQRWKATDGLDRVFFSNGVVSGTKLNEVIWNSYSLALGLKFVF